MTIYKNIANTKILEGDKIPPNPVFISMTTPTQSGYNIDPYTSEDGIFWQKITKFPSLYNGGTPTNIIYGDNKFVIVGDGQDVSYWSGEGMYWVEEPFVGLPPTSTIFYSVGFGNGVFFTPLYQSTNLATSNDGKTWLLNSVLPSSSDWLHTTYGLGLYIISGGSSAGAYSSDTISWTSTTIQGNNNIAFNGTMFAGMGTYSTDGMNWNASVTTVSGQIWGMVAFGNGTFVHQAIRTTPIANATNVIAYSTDGMNWNSVTLPYSKIWKGLLFGNGYFLILGTDANQLNPVILTSPDGITWTTESPNMYPPNLQAYGQPEF